MTKESCFPSDLPCPAPLPEAVEAGAFGVMQDGSLCPDETEVRALTEEHAREMAVLLADLTHLEWCNKLQLDPGTGQPPRPNSRDRLAERLKREISEFTQQYEDCLGVYAEAFGDAASQLLDAAIRRFVDAHFAKETPKIQRQLF